MTKLGPYYQRNGITIYCGDCLVVMPWLCEQGMVFDAIIADPPYPDYHQILYNYDETILPKLDGIGETQFIFWSARAKFPLDYTAVHIWDKRIGVGIGYEKIYERRGGEGRRVFSHYFINSTVAASYTNDTFYGHPSQKPLRLMKELVMYATITNDLILDPFMGSGTTLLAAQNEGRQAVGIELDEDYCKIAVERLRQPSFFSIPDKPKVEAVQMGMGV